MKEEMKKRGLQPVTFSEVITEVNEQVVDTQICRAAPVDPGSGSGSGGGSGNLGPDSFSGRDYGEGSIPAYTSHGGPTAKWEAYFGFNWKATCAYGSSMGDDGEWHNQIYAVSVTLTDISGTLTGIHSELKNGKRYFPKYAMFDKSNAFGQSSVSPTFAEIVAVIPGSDGRLELSVEEKQYDSNGEYITSYTRSETKYIEFVICFDIVDGDKLIFNSCEIRENKTMP